MWDWIGKLDELRNKNQKAVLATVIGIKGSTPREHGAKMIILPDGSFFGTIGGGGVEKKVLEYAKTCFEENTPKKVEVALTPKENMLCGGHMELYLDLINRNPVLYLFGAGHVGQALCRVLSGTPFSIHLIDHREEWVQSKEIPSNIVRHQMHWEEFTKQANWNSNVYCAVMTYNAVEDQKAVELCLQQDCHYIGLVGSAKKWKAIRKSLLEKQYSDNQADKVSCPVGHDNGGKTPQEIAVSIACELLCTLHQKV